ncbi:MAG: non-canonical purine NTP pyrophosphatase, RdgB/HAM1 family [Myxococcales bacterium]|nr:non-canonical purine NTP pyrophosphatase, RdgB/HAM1 family [Myxococcales bacterium]
MKKLVVATGNAHKLDEYRALLPGIQLASMSEFPPMEPVEEDAPDFIGNAILKALAVHSHTGLAALADDSGLEVEALNQRPGVFSARYAAGTDRDRYLKLLGEMENQPNRLARFACAIAIAGLPEKNSDDSIIYRDGCWVSVGYCYGQITEEPNGTNGFGYDPIFSVNDGRTMAQLTAAEKHAISHRGQATKPIINVLRSLMGVYSGSI